MLGTMYEEPKGSPYLISVTSQQLRRTVSFYICWKGYTAIYLPNGITHFLVFQDQIKP